MAIPSHTATNRLSASNTEGLTIPLIVEKLRKFQLNVLCVTETTQSIIKAANIKPKEYIRNHNTQSGQITNSKVYIQNKQPTISSQHTK